jgi:hypothetical protein
MTTPRLQPNLLRRFTSMEVVIAAAVLVVVIGACIGAIVFGFTHISRSHVQAERLRVQSRVAGIFEVAVENAQLAYLDPDQTFVVLVEDGTQATTTTVTDGFGVTTKGKAWGHVFRATDKTSILTYLTANYPTWWSNGKGLALGHAKGKTTPWGSSLVVTTTTTPPLALSMFYVARGASGRDNLYMASWRTANNLSLLAEDVVEPKMFWSDATHVRLATRARDRLGTYALAGGAVLCGPAVAELNLNNVFVKGVNR